MSPPQQTPAKWRTAGRGHKHQPLTFSTLNVQGLSDLTYSMLLADGPEEGDQQRRAVTTWQNGDVIGLTELHTRTKHERWAEESGGRFLCGALPDDRDPAGGVGMVLSRSAAKALKGEAKVTPGIRPYARCQHIG